MTLLLHPTAVVPSDTKWAFTTRRVNPADIHGLTDKLSQAVAGDLVLGQIVEIGQHKKVQLKAGRYSTSYIGDTIVMAVGDRYAPDQFEGIAEIDPAGCDMLASGGILGRMIKSHGRMKQPTQVKPLGLLTDADGEVVNVASYALPQRTIPDDVTVIGVFGASMNAGKTTAVASLAHGLRRAGFKVAGLKATGTGGFGDFNALVDAGVPVRDFTDAGMATTYKMPMERIEAGFLSLVGAAAHEGADVIIVEIADGVFQAETQEILESSTIKERLDAVMFAAPDALGTVGGVDILREHGLEPFAVSGMVTRSPLAIEEAERVTGVRLLSREDLCNPEKASAAASAFLPRAKSRFGRAA